MVEEIGEARVARDVDLEALEGLVEGIERRIGDRADVPAILVLEHDRLEDVVDLTRLEPQFRRRVAADAAGVLEVPDARTKTA